MRFHSAAMAVLASAAALGTPGCGGIIRGNLLRAARNTHAGATQCPRRGVSTLDLGEIRPTNPPPGLMGARVVRATGCGATRDYVCIQYETGPNGSDTRCEPRQ
jgi:hypothetical protein